MGGMDTPVPKRNDEGRENLEKGLVCMASLSVILERVLGRAFADDSR